MRISDWSSDVCSSDLLCGSVLGRGSSKTGGSMKNSPSKEKAFSDHLRQLTAGQGPGRAGQRHVTGPIGQGDALGQHLVHRGGQHFPRQLYGQAQRSEEHTSELQSLMRISYDVFCMKKK